MLIEDLPAALLKSKDWLAKAVSFNIGRSMKNNGSNFMGYAVYVKAIMRTGVEANSMN